MKQMKPSNINVTPNTSDMDDDDIDNNEDTNCEEFGRRIPEISKVSKLRVKQWYFFAHRTTLLLGYDILYLI